MYNVFSWDDTSRFMWTMKKEGVLKTYLTVRYLYKYIINLLSIRFSILQSLQYLYISIENLFLDFQWGTMICFIHSLIKSWNILHPFSALYYLRTWCSWNSFLVRFFHKNNVLSVRIYTSIVCIVWSACRRFE